MKRKIRATTLIASLILMCSLLPGCKKQNVPSAEKTPSPAPERKITIGFSIDTLAIERWQRDMDVFINKAKELGADVIVQNSGNNIEEQNRQLMYLMDRTDAIVVLPKDAASISDSIQKIRAKGIPVISYDRLTLNADINLYMTIDSEKVGEYMASEMMKHSKGTNWYCILGPKEDYNMTLINDGINRIIRNTNVKINHVFHTDNWNYDLSYQEMVRILKSDVFPDAIICGNDAVAASVIQAISRYYPDIYIPVLGSDFVHEHGIQGIILHGFQRKAHGFKHHDFLEVLFHFGLFKHRPSGRSILNANLFALQRIQAIVRLVLYRKNQSVGKVRIAQVHSRCTVLIDAHAVPNAVDGLAVQLQVYDVGRGSVGEALKFFLVHGEEAVLFHILAVEVARYETLLAVGLQSGLVAFLADFAFKLKMLHCFV